MNKAIFPILLVLFALIGFQSCKSHAGAAVGSRADKDIINWMTFEEAMAAAERNPKKIFIDVYTDWCHWCKEMDKTTFRDKKIGDYINRNFYPVKFNGEQREPVRYKDRDWHYISQRRTGYHELAEMLLDGRLEYPAYVLFSEEKKRVQVLPGYMDVQTMGMYLQYFAEDHYQRTPLQSFERNFRGL